MKKRRIVALFNDYTAQIVYLTENSGIGIQPVLSYADEITSVPSFNCYLVKSRGKEHSLSKNIYSAIYEVEELK